ncbi:MAG: 50S ribosomal protein L20 [Candidatus Levybacteria bacterium]|nr:50S ribosomal protein L20 [Candidatus Levybacteria bacterium]
MSRVKRGIISRQKHKKIFALAKGYRGTRSRLIKTATEAVLHADAYAYHGRKRKKRDFRRLWIVRIGEAVKEEGHSYSRFIKAMKDQKIELDRKILAGLITENRDAFTQVVKKAFDGK